MNKIKELWGKNKVLIVLGIILIVCLVTIICVGVSFFFGGSETVYGDRLDDIENYPISEEFKSDYIASLLENEEVSDVTIDIKGRIVYVNIVFVGDTNLANAKSKAVTSLEKFSDELLSYYDINLTLTSKATENSEGFTIMGAKNVAGSGVVWNNNTPVESDED